MTMARNEYERRLAEPLAKCPRCDNYKDTPQHNLGCDLGIAEERAARDRAIDATVCDVKMVEDRLKQLTQEALHPASPSPGHAAGCVCHRCRTYREENPMHYPTHLNCPYCRAQAFPAMLRGSIDGHLGYPTKPVRLYACSQKHKFYVHPEVEEETNCSSSKS